MTDLPEAADTEVKDPSGQSGNRLIAGVVGLVLAAGAIGIAAAAFTGGEASNQLASPIPGPTSSPSNWTGPVPEPVLDVEFDDVYMRDTRYLLGLDMPVLDGSQLASRLMEMADLAFTSDPMIRVGPASPMTKVTTILCLPEAQDEAKLLRDEIFVGAEIKIGTPKHDEDLWVDYGRDFLKRYRFEFDAFSHVSDFLDRREKGRGAEPYISKDVALAYERREDGLALYRYATLPAMYLDSLQLARSGDLVEIAVVPIWGETAYMDDDGPLVEILQVGWVTDPEAEGERRLTILGVHRDTFPFPEG